MQAHFKIIHIHINLRMEAVSLVHPVGLFLILVSQLINGNQIILCLNVAASCLTKLRSGQTFWACGLQ